MTRVSEMAPADELATVLRVDDDAGILKAISRTLGTEFQVVATSDRRATSSEAAHRLDPDVAVLDVSMPGPSAPLREPSAMPWNWD